MKLTTTLTFLGALTATANSQILIPLNPVRGPNTLVFKEIGGVPNNECLTFTNVVRTIIPFPFPPSYASASLSTH